MMLIKWRLCHVLIISSLVWISEGQKQGCADWQLNGNDVCCVKCHPGNRLLEQCGKDPTKLCTPCEAGTFASSSTKFFCDKCTQCRGPRIVLKACNASSDTVCGCKAGLRCGNPQCSFCVDECREGQEPTDIRTCRKCPKGTFNDKIHSKCKEKKTSCPKGEKLVAVSNEFSDNECRKEPEAYTLAPTPIIQIEHNTVETSRTRQEIKDDSFWPLVGFTGGIAVATTTLILALWFTYRRAKNKTDSNKTETKDPLPETLPPEELRVMVEQEETCSFRQPEQEQGGSSESISTQDSETKLIV